MLFTLLFDALTTYLGLSDPTAYEFSPLTRWFIENLGKEAGLCLWFTLVSFSYSVFVYVIDSARLRITEVGFCIIFGSRHLIAGISNLSICLNEISFRIMAEKIFVFWPFTLLIFIIVALVEFTLERA
jgi:hypothetical protein